MEGVHILDVSSIGLSCVPNYHSLIGMTVKLLRLLYCN
jgi:hypothetical protein